MNFLSISSFIFSANLQSPTKLKIEGPDPEIEQQRDPISFEISFNFSVLLDAKVTFAPCDARAQADANPIPEDAPTTRAFFLLKSNDGTSGNVILFSCLSIAYIFSTISTGS